MLSQQQRKDKFALFCNFFFCSFIHRLFPSNTAQSEIMILS